MTTRIGRYEIQAELGRGGFGQVFRALDPVFPRLVAIKVLLAKGDPDLLVRFRNEAGATAKLVHRNIVVVYDFGDHEGSPYLVMELMEGRDLEQIISGGHPMSLLQKVDAISQMAAGLHHAHSRGIVHRDVKPANMMLVAGNTIKIMDFGIALLSQVTAERITPDGSLLGTIPYMSPEQFQGAASDALTDIFALGVTSYKLLTGTHPFQAAELAGLMGNIINKNPEPVRSWIPECPEALERVISRLMAKDREDRYHNLDDVQFDLEPLILELREERLAEAVSEAHDFIASNRLDEAQILVREALDIEPGYRPARELRERIQFLIKDRSVRPRVNALLATGREDLEAQKYDDAIQKFESALRLDRSNDDVRQLIGRAREARERLEKAERLFRNAEQAFGRGSLTIAQQIALDALLAYPEHGPAKELLEGVRHKLTARDREAQLREGLNRVRGLMLVEDLDAAVQLLKELQDSFPGSSGVIPLLEEARFQKAEQVRRTRLRQKTEEVRQILNNHKVTEAAELLARLLEEFPESKELSALASYVNEEKKREAEAAAIEGYSKKARELIRTERLDEAITTLRVALSEHAGSSGLRELLHTAETTKAERSRAAALEKVIEDANSLIKRHEFKPALDRITAFVTTYGSASALDAIRVRAEEGIEKLRRVNAVRRLLLDAQGLLDEGRPGTASNVLQQATVLYPDESEIANLQKVAEARVLEQRQVKEVSEVIAEAERRTQAGRFAEAVRFLEEATRKYPSEERVALGLGAARSAKSAFERDQALKEATGVAAQLASDGRFAEAIEGLDAAIRIWGRHESLASLKTRIHSQFEAHQLNEAIRGKIANAKNLLDRGDALSATRILEGLPPAHRNPEITRLIAGAQELLREQQEAAEIDRLIAEIQSLRHSDRLEAAEKLAISALEKYQGSERIRKEYEVSTQERDQAHRLDELAGSIEGFVARGELETALSLIVGVPIKYAQDKRIAFLRDVVLTGLEVAAIVSQAEVAKKASKLDEALHLVANGLKKFPENADLFELQRRFLRDQDEFNRRQAIDRVAEHALSLLKANDARGALAALNEFIGRFPGESRLMDLAAQARAEIDRAARAEQIAQIEAQAQRLLVSGDFDEAIALMEENRGDSAAFDALLGKARVLQKTKRHNELLTEARRLCDQSEFGAALPVVQRAIVQFGGTAESTELRDRLQSELDRRSRREQVDRALARMQELDAQAAAPKTSAISLKRARLEAATIKSTNPSEPEIADLEGRIAATVKTALTRVRKRREKLALFLAAGLGLSSGGAFLYRIASRQPDSVHVEVRTDPQGASVTLGSHACLTPHCVFEIPSGQYFINAVLKGYLPLQRRIDATDVKEHYVMDLILQPVPPPAPATSEKGFGVLRIQTSEPGAVVLVDGVPQGRTDRSGGLTAKLSADRHVVRAEKSDFQPSEHAVNISMGSTQSIGIELKRLSPAIPPPPNAKIPSNPPAPVKESPTPEQMLEQDWRTASESRDPSQLRAFVSKHPGSHADEAQTLLDDWDWSHVNTSDASALSGYLDQFPSGRHAREAKDKIADLAWSTLDRSSESALRLYIQQNPGGSHRHEAENAIAEIQRQAAAQKKPPVDNEAHPRPSESQAFGIHSALDQFNAAFQRKQPRDLKKIWPSVPNEYIEAMHLGGATFVMTLKPVEQPVVTGDLAAVACDLVITSNARGQSNQSRKRVTVRLQEHGESWYILDPLGS